MIDHQLLLESNTDASLVWRPLDNRYRPMQHPDREKCHCNVHRTRFVPQIVLPVSVICWPERSSWQFRWEEKMTVLRARSTLGRLYRLRRRGHCGTLWTPFGLCHSPTCRSAPPPDTWDIISPEFMPRQH